MSLDTVTQVRDVRSSGASMPAYYHKLNPEQKSPMYRVQTIMFFGVVAIAGVVIAIVFLAS